MKTLLIVLTLVEVAILVVVLALYLIVIAAKLRKISHTLGLVTFGVRAIEKQTEPIGPVASDINSSLEQVAGRWNRSSARRTPSRRDLLGRRRREARRELTMATAPPGTVERRRLRITGVVQGVGFRPFVHGLAARHRLGGFVLNDGRGVVSRPRACRSACRLHRRDRRGGSAARPDRRRRSRVDRPGRRAKFRIERSGGGGSTALVPPDTATCDDCLRELFDPADRRHRYPFINCTQCGPRFTIVERVPYDRANTTMAGFEMCGPCRAEYEDPETAASMPSRSRAPTADRSFASKTPARERGDGRSGWRGGARRRDRADPWRGNRGDQGPRRLSPRMRRRERDRRPAAAPQAP